MGIFNTLMGNASSIDVNNLDPKVKEFLLEDENVAYAFSYVRDMILFTNYRIIFVDKQGVTGKKVGLCSIPYKSINRFSIETSGHFDDDSELKLWLSGNAEPIIIEFSQGKNIYEVEKIIVKSMCC